MQIVTVYNNERVLHGGLKASHPNILENTSITLIDNTQGKYASFSNAVQDNLHLLTDEILVITHQDVIFYDDKSFLQIPEWCHSIDNDGCFFAGVAGRVEKVGYKEGVGIGNIISGGSETGFLTIDKPHIVNTFDECVMITNLKTMKQFGLFENTVIKWHLYAVEACTILAKNDFKRYVLPVQVNHLSAGNCNTDYFLAGQHLLKKHQVNELYTTNGKLTRTSVVTRNLKYKARTILGF